MSRSDESMVENLSKVGGGDWSQEVGDAGTTRGSRRKLEIGVWDWTRLANQKLEIGG